MKICIYSVNIGRYDYYQDHIKQTVPCDFGCYTEDFENLNPHETSNYMKSKIYRMFPNKCSKLQGYDLAIYIDGNVRIISERFIEEILNSNIMDYEFGISKHNEQDCVYNEIEISKRISKYDKNLLDRYTERYKTEQFPIHNGLYWAGFIVHNLNNTSPMFEHWWKECNYFGSVLTQDQVTLPYAIHKTKPNFKLFEPEYKKDHWVRIYGHRE